MKRIIITVTNDLYTDQRVHRVAQSLSKIGGSITLVGRKLPYSPPLLARSYKLVRFKLWFNKGFLFYANYNIHLFFYLLFNKADIIISNDLDTLTACFFAAKIKRAVLVYDSHEYFTEVPELINRRFIRNIWLFIERVLLPKVKNSYTVNDSLAEIYSNKYKISMKVVRNLPTKIVPNNLCQGALNFPGKRILLYQGSLNKSRGLELAIDAMQYIESAILVIIGEGDISHQLHKQVVELNLSARVKFLGRISLDQLSIYTCGANLGLSLEENAGLNYYYSLPNKLFDYIQAQVPVIASDFPETSKIIHKYNIGCTIIDRNPIQFAALINSIFNDPARYALWKSNLKNAAEELCWENEESRLLAIFHKLLNADLELA